MTKPTTQKRRQISLSDDAAERGRELGDGNLSEGIRRAIDLATAANQTSAAELIKSEGIKVTTKPPPAPLTTSDLDAINTRIATTGCSPAEAINAIRPHPSSTTPSQTPK